MNMNKKVTKPNRVMLNMTGRRFMCVSKNSELVDNFSENFTIGKSYPEAIMDSEGENITEVEDELLLLSDNDIPIYIDSSDFVEIEGISTIVVNSFIYLN